MMTNVHHDREIDSEPSEEAGTMLILDSPAVTFVMTLVIPSTHRIRYRPAKCSENRPRPG